MRIYLAARYSRRGELCRYAAHLAAMGHEITSRWLKGDHQLDDAGLSMEAPEEERARFAVEDMADLSAADMCISFTEEPRASPGRGGRHAEFGAAWKQGLRCVVIGHRENVFHYLPEVEFYPTWEAFWEAFRSLP